MFLLHSPISDQENVIQLQYKLDEVEAENEELRKEIKTKDAELLYFLRVQLRFLKF